MDVGSVRLDGTIRTEFDLIESIREIKQIKKILWCSWLENRKQFDFIYDTYLGEVECSVVREHERYSGYLKFDGRYYSIPQHYAREFYSIIIGFIEEIKYKDSKFDKKMLE